FVLCQEGLIETRINDLEPRTDLVLCQKGLIETGIGDLEPELAVTNNSSLCRSCALSER
ncbi:1247_t:CDS:2, partial [Racocetra persica]